MHTKAGEKPAEDVIFLDDIRAQPPFGGSVQNVLFGDHVPSALAVIGLLIHKPHRRNR